MLRRAQPMGVDAVRLLDRVRVLACILGVGLVAMLAGSEWGLGWEGGVATTASRSLPPFAIGCRTSLAAQMRTYVGRRSERRVTTSRLLLDEMNRDVFAL